MLELPSVFVSGRQAVALHLGDGENSATELSELKLAVTA